MNLQDKLKNLKYEYVYHGIDNDEFFSLIDAFEIAVSALSEIESENGLMCDASIAEIRAYKAIKQIKIKLGCV
jgi:hypothetical protein